jgi:glycerophosphoryl diester phosphodiesterase
MQLLPGILDYSPSWLDRFGYGAGPAIIAHRGQHEHTTTSNDIEALDAAARDGVSDAVELDIRRLGDGTLVVYHDAALVDGPLAGSQLVQLSAADLANYPRIATLDSWARRAGLLGVNVLAEFKEAGYEAVALAALQRSIRPDRLAVMSFSQDALRGVHAVDPSVPLGLLARRSQVRPTLAQQLASLGFRPRFVELNRANATPEALATVADLGLDLVCGTTNPDWQRQLSGMRQVIGMLTDFPTPARYVRDDVLRGVASIEP